MTSRYDSKDEITLSLNALTLAFAELKAKTETQEMMIKSLILVLRRSNPDIASNILDFFVQFTELGLSDLLNEASEIEIECFKFEFEKAKKILNTA